MSTPIRPARPRTAPALLVAGVLLVTVLTVVLDSRTSPAARTAAQMDRGVLGGLVGTVLALAGATVLHRYPRHRVGLVLAGFGVLWAVDGLLESWAAYGTEATPDLPGTAFATWFVERVGAFLLVALPALLVLYPTGRLMPGRWGTVGRVTLLMAAALPASLVLAPARLVYQGEQQSVSAGRFDPLALPLPDDVAVALLTASRLATLLSLVLAVVVLLARRRHASAYERAQLSWLLWAAIVCVLSALALLVVPSGPVAYAALVAALTTTAASVVVGIVKPDLTDVDALVAGTVVHGGAAAAVVGIDLLALAAVDRFLGDRLAEREVTLLVLVLAVTAYGPLRAWLGVLVRRLFLGRRGDRYHVVSSLAARLEESGDIDEQLPALAAAVASTFKVGFVRVEVLGSDGSSVSASHGVEPEQTHELPIGYRGERVGRLVLPRTGVRALLSRSDQLLLVDLVRQAAIAMRSSRLAAELQDSREALVLGREEDRRRIRRDLHDGLGPVLGGVAMRLDAAGNALETDPDSSRRLIRQSREDVKQALDDVRRLVHDLRPPALDDLGLLAAVQQQVDRARSAPLAVEVQAEGLGPLPAAVEVAAYRIVSEALTNVVRHATATRCRVSLVGTGTALELEVADDGTGIGADVAAGVGLLSMRERVEELGGRHEIVCPPDGGTRVRAWLPVTQTEQGRLMQGAT